MAAGLVILVALLDIGSGPEIVTWPLMLAGFGAGALASQLGAVTVGAVPDERSGEVGGLQNTATNLGSSIATALMGAVLISTLTSTFLTGLAENPDVPASVTANAEVELAAGIRSCPTRTSRPLLDESMSRRPPPMRSWRRTPRPVFVRSRCRSRCSPCSRCAPGRPPAPERPGHIDGV